MSHRKKRPVEVNQWGKMGRMGNQLSVVSFHLSVIGELGGLGDFRELGGLEMAGI